MFKAMVKTTLKSSKPQLNIMKFSSGKIIIEINKSISPKYEKERIERHRRLDEDINLYEEKIKYKKIIKNHNRKSGEKYDPKIDMILEKFCLVHGLQSGYIYNLYVMELHDTFKKHFVINGYIELSHNCIEKD